MKNLSPERINAIVMFLRDFPANGQIDLFREEAAMDAYMIGLVKQETQTGRCQTCGTERVDHRYYRMTSAGRLLMQVMGDK